MELEDPTQLAPTLPPTPVQTNPVQPGSIQSSPVQPGVARAVEALIESAHSFLYVQTPQPVAPAPPRVGNEPVPSAPAPISPAPVSPAPVSPAPRRASLLGGIAAELVTAALLTERRAVALALQARDTGETFVRAVSRELQGGELEAVYEFMAQRCGRELIKRKSELLPLVIDAAWLPVAVAESRGILLLRSENAGEALYATLDPYDLLTRDWVGRLSGKRPVPAPALPDVLAETIGRLRMRDELEDTGKPLVPIDITWEQEQRIRDKVESCDIPLLVDYLVHRAYEQDASDIHIEPGEDGTVVRVRIDGMLHEECRVPLSMHAAVTSRIKVLAGMDVAELNKLLKMQKQMADTMKKVSKMGKGAMLKQAMRAMTGKGGGLPDLADVDPAKMAEATKMLQDQKGLGGQLGGLNLPGGLSGLFGKR